MLGYAFPLYVLGSVQLVLALMLLGPIQTARPVIGLAKLTKLPVGNTIVLTLTALLTLFLVPMLWEVSSFGRRTLHDEAEIGSLRQRCTTPAI